MSCRTRWCEEALARTTPLTAPILAIGRWRGLSGSGLGFCVKIFLMPGLSPIAIPQRAASGSAEPSTSMVSLSSKLSNQIFDLKSIVRQFGLQEGMRIADLGSGSGYFTIEIAKAVGEGGAVTAMDILDTALETVRARAISEGVKNIQLVRANLEIVGSTSLADDSQDFVLIKNVLFQNDGKLEIIKEAERVLRPAGKLVIIDWEKGAGGFGPPDEYRTPKESILVLANQEKFIYEKDISIDVYHFGMMFRK